MVCPYFKNNYGKDYRSACSITDPSYELPNEMYIKIFCISKQAFEWCAKYRAKHKDNNGFTKRTKLKKPLV